MLERSVNNRWVAALPREATHRTETRGKLSPNGRGRVARAMLVATLLILLLLSPVPIRGRVAAKSSAHSLAGTNVIVGTQIAGTRVRLNEPAALHRRDVDPFVTGRRPNVRIEGNGRVAGAILIRDTEDPLGAEDPSFVMWVRGGFCRRERCGARATHTFALARGLQEARGDDKVYLRPGNYFLYVVADGAPVQVTLDLDGPQGKRTFAPGVDVRADVRTPEVGFSAGPGKQAHWFGEDYLIKGEGGLSYSAFQLKSKDWLAGEVGWCAYTGEPDPGPLAYSPVCPSGFNFVTPIVRVPPMRVQVLDRGIAQSESGRHGFGHHLVTTGTVERVDGLFFFVDFDRSDFR